MKLNEDGLCLELTENCRTQGFRTILSMLASEEMEHFNTIAFLEGTNRKLFAGEDKSLRKCE